MLRKRCTHASSRGESSSGSPIGDMFRMTKRLFKRPKEKKARFFVDRSVTEEALLETPGWSSLCADVIGHIAETLKRNGRWQREGPVLRALNRHWRQCLSDNITEIRPHSCRALSAQDFETLTGLRHLSLLNVTTLLKQRTDAVADIIRDLSAISSLTRLELMDCNGLTAFLESEALTKLTSVTSLKLTAVEWNQSLDVSDAAVRNVCRLPLCELSAAASLAHTRRFLYNIPSLKRLTVRKLGRDLTAEDLVRLNQLQAVSAEYSYSSPEQLAAVRSLVSVGILMKPRSIQSVTVLCHLTSLTLRIDTAVTEDVVDLSCLAALTRLRSLEIKGETGPWPIRLNAPLPHLQKLVLAGSVLSGVVLRDNLPNLSVLSLTDCEIDNVCVFMEALHSVEALLLRDNLDKGTASSLCVAWCEAYVPKLRRLVTQINGAWSTSALTVLSLTQLEKLAFGGYAYPEVVDPEHSFKLLKRIEPLRSLRELHLWGLGDFDSAACCHKLRFLTELDVLSIGRHGWEPDEGADAPEVFRAMAPHLRTDKGVRHLESRVQSWFDLA